MAKLNYDMLNKGIKLQGELNTQLDNYDTQVVGALDEQLEGLQAEHEHLLQTANVIKVGTDMREYMNNQKRLQELPTLIADVERERINLIENKADYKRDICLGINKDIGTEYKAEFNDNMNLLLAEYEEHLNKLIALTKDMEQLENQYKWGLSSVINTNGVYMEINKNLQFSRMLGSHNLTPKQLYLQYAK